MATYGKKKKIPLLSSFSVFQDDEENEYNGGIQKSQSHLNLQSERGLSGSTMVNQKHEDEVIATIKPTEPKSRPFSNVNSTGNTQNQNPRSQIQGKHLPEQLNLDNQHQRDQKKHERPVLADKSTNMRLKKKRGRRAELELPPESPTPPPTIQEARAKYLSPLRFHPVNNEPPLEDQDFMNTFAGPAARGSGQIGKKLEGLIGQAKNSKIQGPPTASGIDQITKPRLIRSKELLAKAGQAIVDHLRESPFASMRRKKSGILETQKNEEDLSPISPVWSDIDGSRLLDRRVAEGRNLGNSKIQNLTGMGIQQKSLSINQRMVNLSAIERAYYDDPFSDKHELSDAGPMADYSAFDFGNFDACDGAAQEVVPHLPGITRQLLPSHNTASADRASPIYLHIDPNGELEPFSSSPLSYSTPRIRTQQNPEPHSKILMRTALGDRSCSISPSPMESGGCLNGESDEDDEPHPGIRMKKPADGSTKRKGKQREGALLRPQKRSKRSDTTPHAVEDALSAGMGRLATGTLASREANRRLFVENTERLLGINMFDIKKDQNFHEKVLDTDGEKRSNTVARKLTLIPKPSEKPRRAKSRAAKRESMLSLLTKPKKSEDNDRKEFSVDELQMDLTAHQITAKKLAL